MLNKTVCHQCLWLRELRVSKDGGITPHEEDFEDIFNTLWDTKFIVICLPGTSTISEMLKKIDESPPERCPYYLEHIVSAKC